MKDIKLKSAAPQAAKPPPPPGLVSVDESIDDIALKALEAAQRAKEKLEAIKRDAEKTGKTIPIKAAT